MRTISLLLAALPLLLGACDEAGRACTLIGCESSLVVDLPDDLAPGAWTFTLSADEMQWTCEAGLPLGAEEPACSGFDVAFVVDQSAAIPRLEAIRLAFAPEVLGVTATHDGTVRASQQFTPDYDELYPNGRECDRVPCLQQTVQLEVAP